MTRGEKGKGKSRIINSLQAPKREVRFSSLASLASPSLSFFHHQLLLFVPSPPSHLFVPNHDAVPVNLYSRFLVTSFDRPLPSTVDSPGPSANSPHKNTLIVGDSGKTPEEDSLSADRKHSVQSRPFPYLSLIATGEILKPARHLHYRLCTQPFCDGSHGRCLLNHTDIASRMGSTTTTTIVQSLKKILCFLTLRSPPSGLLTVWPTSRSRTIGLSNCPPSPPSIQRSKSTRKTPSRRLLSSLSPSHRLHESASNSRSISDPRRR